MFVLKPRVLATHASLTFTLLFHLLFFLPSVNATACPTDLTNATTASDPCTPSPSMESNKPHLTLFVILAITFASLFIITLVIILTFLKIRQIRAEKRRVEHRQRTAQIQEMYRGAGPDLSWKQQQQQRQSEESILLTMPVLAKTKTPWKDRTTTRQMPTPPTMSDFGYPGMRFAYAV